MTKDAGDTKCDVLLAAIVQHKRTHDGNTPTISSLQQLCSISSKSVVHHRLRRLEQRGLIRCLNRQIEVVGGEWTLGDVTCTT